MSAENGRLVMRLQTFWNLLQITFVGALLPAMVAAQDVPAAGPAQQSARQEPARPRTAKDAFAQETATTDVAGGLTLEQLQQMALANNPTLAQAKAGVRAAAGRSRQAGLWPNPTIGYSGDEIRGGSFGGGEERVVVQAEGKQAAAEGDEQRLRVENGVRIAFYQSLAMQAMVETRGKLRDIAKDA